MVVLILFQVQIKASRLDSESDQDQGIAVFLLYCKLVVEKVMCQAVQSLNDEASDKVICLVYQSNQ